MSLDNSIISIMLVGEWRTFSGENTKYYEFLVDRDIVIYSDWNYPKAEAATFTLKSVEDKHQLEIKHPNNPIPTEVYEISELDNKKMIWSYLVEDEIKRIKLEKYLG